jgi:N-acyl-L-homoserine lactone synthetase
MHMVSSAPEGLPVGLLSKVAQYRHKVFVEQLGWPLQTQNGAELDQFDRPDTIYVIAQDDHNHVVGCARLLPTTTPYLLGELFPQLLNGLTPPSSPDVWEISRFAAVDFSGRPTTPLKQFSSQITLALLQETIACAAVRGAKRLITVSPIGVERLLQNMGINTHRAGPPIIIDGQPIVGLWIEMAKEIS